MKHSYLLALGLATAVSVSGPVSALSSGDPAAGTLPVPAESQVAVAQNAPRFDADGYLIGPNGERLTMPLRPRWRVGVFR